MKFIRFDNLETFRSDVLPVLYENEVLNNLFINVITGQASGDPSSRFMGTVVDDFGHVVLVAYCAKPFNMMLYTPLTVSVNSSYSSSFPSEAVLLTVIELKKIGFVPPGVFAETRLAQGFAEAYFGYANARDSRAMLLMELRDFPIPISDSKPVPGACRVLRESDIALAASWERDFSRECRIPVFPLDEYAARIRMRLGRDIHYFWEVDGVAVSQAVFGRETTNGAVVNWVYTPPEHRSEGYGTAVVAELSRVLLERGKKYCCLFADADNKTSCGIYTKLGYKTIAEFEETAY